jgi:hypothetical protein
MTYASRSWVGVIVLGLLGCHPQPGVQPTPSSRAIGSYTYRARLGAYDEVGVFGISPDTVIVNPRASLCIERQPSPRDNLYRGFSCTGTGTIRSVNLIIDLQKPSASRWTAMRIVTVPNRDCITDSVTPSGQKLCLRYSTQQLEVEQQFSGQLFVSPVKLGEPPVQH